MEKNGLWEKFYAHAMIKFSSLLLSDMSYLKHKWEIFATVTLAS